MRSRNALATRSIVPRARGSSTALRWEGRRLRHASNDQRPARQLGSARGLGPLSPQPPSPHIASGMCRMARRQNQPRAGQRRALAIGAHPCSPVRQAPHSRRHETPRPRPACRSATSPARFAPTVKNAHSQPPAKVQVNTQVPTVHHASSCGPTAARSLYTASSIYGFARGGRRPSRTASATSWITHVIPRMACSVSSSHSPTRRS